MKVVVFGTGEIYVRYKKWFSKSEIIAFLDNDSKKQGEKLDGIFILPPSEITKLETDRIYVMSSYFEEMTKQLLGYGISKSKIFYTYNLAELIPPSREEVNLLRDLAEKKIVFISDDLKFSGAQYALFDAAKCLKKIGYDVMVVSPVHGKMEMYLQECEIPVRIEERIAAGMLSDLQWIEKSRLIFINTTTYLQLLAERNTRIPVIWWSHEPELFLKDNFVQLLKRIDRTNLSIYAVSDIAKYALNKYNPQFSIGLLPIGIERRYKEHSACKHRESGKHLLILLVGEICELKGQRLLLEATDYLSYQEQSSLEIHLIGRIQKGYDISFMKPFIKKGMLRLCGELCQKELESEYMQSDVVICASHVETLSAVVIEAIQRKIPVIVSDGTGISAYLKDQENALLFHSNDAEGLSEKIRWCLHNRDPMQKLGHKAYRIYEKYFTRDIFEKQLISIVKGVIG